MPYVYQPYQESDEVKRLREQYNTGQANKPTYTSQYGDRANQALDAIMNRQKFSYDINGDALYDQYRDRYVSQGRMAMRDTMGQAAGLTGGYGSSYGQAVGQQQYNAYLQNLSDKIPELQNAALNRYNAEGDRMQSQYAALANAEAQEYGRYQDQLSAWQRQQDQAKADLDAADARDYARWQDQQKQGAAQYNAEQSLAQSQVNYLLSLGITPSDDLIAASGLTREYINAAVNQNKPQQSGSVGSYDVVVSTNNGKERLLSNHGKPKKKSKEQSSGDVVGTLIGDINSRGMDQASAEKYVNQYYSAGVISKEQAQAALNGADFNNHHAKNRIDDRDQYWR